MTTPSAPLTDLPVGISMIDGLGSLPAVAVAHPSATALIYLHGAHVAEWCPTGQLPVLWMSALSRYSTADPLRGGIPLCFPWFGKNATDATLPNHGWARLAEWTLISAESGADAAELTFELTEQSVGVPDGTAPMRLLYVVTVGAELTADLQVINTADRDLTFEEAFHTYVTVGEITATTIGGFENLPYLDRAATPEATGVSAQRVLFGGEHLERIYPMPALIDVDDAAQSRVITVVAPASAQSVIWNPGSVKAADIADFGDDEFTSMVCVEAANVLDGAITLAPGASNHMTTTLAVR
ncbi:glucose-6-phosphate 1-epimerase [Glaciihabitans tibetensis]|uniref:Putative glucose-6-phosphate 1-epimerase n=1 Tax=Glaciihabitans tibetensis TaxID=1266600 RepID=A0A2T0VE48_9MICO|nr:D-hexose-6-phosphate mutarotase [Glaciihabitans tibetensis]PRY68448.1 glucose-6-phosphate 1-epimerase [Glaciihabitans tibetensis]